MITSIIILNVDENDGDAQGGEKVLVCHKPAKKGGHSLSISSSPSPPIWVTATHSDPVHNKTFLLERRDANACPGVFLFPAEYFDTICEYD